jgi:hypothetical protein
VISLEKKGDSKMCFGGGGGSSSGGSSGGGSGGGFVAPPPPAQPKTPTDAQLEQERLAEEELRQKRIEKSRAKQSLLNKRLERTQEFGSGKKVLTGKEKELGKMSESSLIAPATGKRSGSGRRSLLTGSTGGIGFYSRYL